MPTGSPKNGFRMTKKRKAAMAAGLPFNSPKILKREASKALAFQMKEIPVLNETDEEIESRLTDRFEILSQLAQAAITGEARALIVSGPAGLGKSYTIETELASWDPEMAKHRHIKGFVKATGLYKLLYQFRDEGKVLVFDDADSIFFDETSLNMLKAVCDTNEKRTVSYLADYKMVDEETAELIPNNFEFNGTIIFITNYDFDAMIDRGHKLAPHLQAMVSRAHYIDLAMRNKRDYLVRIRQVIKQGLLKSKGLSFEQEKEVLTFINSNSERLRELSLRIALKIASILKTSKNWQKIATVTCCKNS